MKNAEQAKLGINSVEEYGFNLMQVLQSFLDKSDNPLKMYGTVNDLLANLKIYHDFSLKHKKFGIPGHTMEALVNNQKDPMKYKSLKGDLFYNKQDYIHNMYAQIHSKYVTNNTDTSPQVLECMKRNEEKLDGCYEFFRYDQVIHSELRELVTKIHENLHDKGVPRNLTNIPSKFRDVPGQIRQNRNSVIPVPRGDTKSDAVMLQKIIDSYPHIFRPYSKTNSSNYPLIVRIFEDIDQKFVMMSELSKDSRIEKND